MNSRNFAIATPFFLFASLLVFVLSAQAKDKISSPVWIEGSQVSKQASLCLRDGLPYLLQNEKPYVQKIDVEKKVLVKEKFSSDVVPISLQATKEGKLFFVARGGTRNKLLVEDAKGWTAYTLPDEVKQSDMPNLKVTVDKNGIAVSLKNNLYIKRENEWVSSSVPPLKPGMSPNLILYGKQDVFLSYNMGDQGGALASYNLGKGEFFITEKVLPVTAMCLDKGGTLWFTGAESSSLQVGGSLRSFHNEKLLLHADTYGDLTKERGLVKVRADNWSGAPTMFTSLAFDKAGQIYIGTKDQGVFKSLAGKFVQVSEPLSGGSASSSKISQMLPFEGNLLFIVPGKGVFFQEIINSSK